MQKEAGARAPGVPSGVRSDEEYRRAMAEASRAPKEGTGTVSERPRMSRAEAERAAREMLMVERQRIADQKAERDRKSGEGTRVEETRIAANTPRAVGPPARNRDRAIEEGSATGAASQPARQPKPRHDRPAAECPAAGRRVSLPGTYVVKGGDTLWKIAERFYGDGEAFTRILKANKGRIPDPDVIEPCKRLILPRR